MTEGIRFARGDAWLVSGGVSEPVLTEVAGRLDSIDPELAEFVRRGILTQMVSADALPDAPRETLRRTVIEVGRQLLDDGATLHELVVPAGMDAEVAEGRMEAAQHALQEMLDMAERAARAHE
jgi:hypothetical protein